ncbi:hypothetical protein [Caenispirillum bisanense]|uniref:Uncharacterized protein n=1 Tax=Caenispirillum bisanense TaxID=414052 RepID=A0A286GWZ7_9PROT|nr:hypothetical protein [Caenispirillum bisanense]SOE00023.1 hypothetical protein SAMN05421508_11143 [Caenispirillum bisanense]
MASFDLSSLLTLRLGRRRRYVLTVGEECAVLTLVGGSRVENAWIVAADPEEGIAEVKAVLDRDRKTPVAFLADTFEQIYREEAVPKVGRFDQAKVMRRHAASAVPADMWQGALPQGQDPRGAKLFYLFCGLPGTPRLDAWMTWYQGLPNPQDGFHLLPLESLALMNALFAGEAKAQGGVRWRIMTTMNISGGLRQIVAKQGRMMLTRLTPAPPDDMDAREAAAAMARDFRQTLTYVKRMGYREGDALDLAFIVDPELAEELRQVPWEAQSMLATTPHEVGQRLGLGSVGKPEQPFGDVLHAAWFGRAPRPALKLARRSANPRQDLARQLEPLAPLGAVLATAGVLTGMWLTGEALWQTHQEIERATASLERARGRLETTRAEHAALPYNPAVMRETMALAAQLRRGEADLPPFLRAIDQGLKNRAHATVLELRNGALLLPEPGQPVPPAAAPQPGVRSNPPRGGLWAGMELELADVTDAKAALVLSERLMEDLTAALPDAKVMLIRPPVNILPDQTMTTTVRLERPAEDPAAPGGAPPPPAPAAGAPGQGGETGPYTMRIEISRGAAP